MKRYIWQKPGWQDFQSKWDKRVVTEPLAEARFLQGELVGKIASLDFKLQAEAQGDILIAEVLETSKIEGVELNIESVRSSVAERLGLPEGIGAKKDRYIDGAVEVLIDAVRNHEKPLTLKRLNTWHAALFPLGVSGLTKISAGKLREGPMKVVSGYIGAEKIHFEAPPAEQIHGEVKLFIDWFNERPIAEDGLLRAAAAHLKFVTIHPFDDGNGRISRALTDMAMAQDEKMPFRSYSLSSQIMGERRVYYQILEDVQSCRAGLDEWYLWFIAMFSNAVRNSQKLISHAFFKAAFWNKIKDITLNERQHKVVQKMISVGTAGFAGGLTTRKYVSMAKVSNATAYREIDDMYKKGVLRQFGAGRSVRYELNV